MHIHRPGGVVLVGWALAMVYAFPGYMNYDAAEQLYQARTRIDDWHPPLMAAYWRVLELAARGPCLLLLLQMSLFAWGLFEMLRLRLAPRTAAIVAAALLVFPPILTPLAPVLIALVLASGLLYTSSACSRLPRHPTSGTRIG